MDNYSSIAWQDASFVSTLGFIPWAEAEGKTFVVSGVSGLIGGTIVRALAARNLKTSGRIKIIGLARDVIRASEILGDVPDVEIVCWDANSGVIPDIEYVDYVLHCAAPTASIFFSQRPIETIDAVINGTRALLQLADRCGASFVLASTMEVYGSGAETAIDESSTAGMDTQNPRNSYPAAKIAAEALCTAFATERGIQTAVARLAQSFGPGVPRNDQRVFAEFARACVDGKDICLHTAGTKMNTYVYSADAAAALLLLAFRGETGLAYNVANESTLTSIREMAVAVADKFGKGLTKVLVEIDEELARNFRPDGKLDLDTTRLRGIGWTPTYGLMDMYDRLIQAWEEDK